MAKSYIWSYLTLFLVFEILISSSLAATDRLDVEALNHLYENFSRPSQLIGWKSDGGDPCDDSWKGVSCYGTSVIYIELTGLGLTGQLGKSFYLQNLKQLDLSSNYIQGKIPSHLPLNLTYLDLSCNNFSMSIPYALAFLKHLHHLNLSHNFLSGPVGNLFTSMQNLRRMDLSHNSLSGDLPSSFANLTNVTDLYLQENKFTGSVIFLAHLHLTNLNIENNKFSGTLPKQLQNVPHIWIGGNKFLSEYAGVSSKNEHLNSQGAEKQKLELGFVAAIAGIGFLILCVTVVMARNGQCREPILPTNNHEMTEKAPYEVDSKRFLQLKEEATHTKSRIRGYVTQLNGVTRCFIMDAWKQRTEYEDELKNFILDDTDASITYLVEGIEGEYLNEDDLFTLKPEEVYVFPKKLMNSESQQDDIPVCLMVAGRGEQQGNFVTKVHSVIRLSSYEHYQQMENDVLRCFGLDRIRRMEWVEIGGGYEGTVTDGEKYRYKIWRGAVGGLHVFL